MRRSRWVLLLWLLAWTGAATAAITAYPFDDSERERRFRVLTNELRCLVCQNQSIAESDAELAKDLRRKTYRMIREGKSDRQIIDFMVSRYGDFILYRPPFNAGTALLWAGPLLLLFTGAGVLITFVRKKKPAAADSELHPEERRRLEQLLRRTEEQSR